MNKNELIRALNFYQGNNDISTVLYFILEDNASLTIKKVDVENTIQERMTKLFTEYIDAKFIQNEQLSYIPLSQFDDRKNVAYRYDYDTTPGRLNFMDSILTNPVDTVFNFRNDNLDNLFGYLMVIGDETNKLSIFRKYSPLDLIKRDKRLYMLKSAERFVPMSHDGFILDKGFDFMKLSTDLVIVKPTTLEKYFDFEEIIKAEAEKGLVAIETSAFIEDIDEFKIYTETNKPFQKKVIKAKTSPVLNVSFARVALFVQNTESLSRKLKLNNTGTKFDLKSAASKKLFLKLLNDDILNSPLTDIQYDSRAKDILE